MYRTSVPDIREIRLRDHVNCRKRNQFLTICAGRGVSHEPTPQTYSVCEPSMAMLNRFLTHEWAPSPALTIMIKKCYWANHLSQPQTLRAQSRWTARSPEDPGVSAPPVQRSIRVRSGVIVQYRTRAAYAFGSPIFLGSRSRCVGTIGRETSTPIAFIESRKMLSIAPWWSVTCHHRIIITVPGASAVRLPRKDSAH
jgi:hypothetical protein